MMMQHFTVEDLRQWLSIWVDCYPGCFFNKPHKFTRPSSCSFSLFSSMFNMCQMSFPGWFLCVCERCTTWGTAKQMHKRMQLYWWVAASGVQWHQAAFPTDNHRERHLNPICSLWRAFTKIGKSRTCLFVTLTSHVVSCFISSILNVAYSSPTYVPHLCSFLPCLDVDAHTRPEGVKYTSSHYVKKKRQCFGLSTLKWHCPWIKTLLEMQGIV